MKKIIALLITVMMISSALVTGIAAKRVYNTTEIPAVTTTEKFVKCVSNGHGDDSPLSGVSDFTFRVVMKTPTGAFEDTDLGELAAWWFKSPTINMKTGAISFREAPGSVTYSGFTYDTLYTIDYVVADGATTIYVNGTEVGTIAEAMPAQLYGAFYRAYVKEVSFIVDGDVVAGTKADNFDDGDTVAYLADAEVVTQTIKDEHTIALSYNQRS